MSLIRGEKVMVEYGIRLEDKRGYAIIPQHWFKSKKKAKLYAKEKHPNDRIVSISKRIEAYA